MKKLFTLLTVLATCFAFAQPAPTGTNSNGKFKMYFPNLGAKKDSVCVWDSTSKEIRYVPRSTFSYVPPLSDVLNVDNTANNSIILSNAPITTNLSPGFVNFSDGSLTTSVEGGSMQVSNFPTGDAVVVTSQTIGDFTDSGILVYNPTDSGVDARYKRTSATISDGISVSTLTKAHLDLHNDNGAQVTLDASGSSIMGQVYVTQSDGKAINIDPTNGISFQTNTDGNYVSYLKNDNATTSGQIYNLPNKAPGIPYTLATTADIGGVVSVSGTENEVSVDNTDPANPIVGLVGDIKVQTIELNGAQITYDGAQFNFAHPIEASNFSGSSSGANTGDQTSIVGLAGTKAQYNTSLTDGDFLFVGDVTQYTDEMAQDAVGNNFDSTLNYNDGANSFGRAAISGAISIGTGSNTASIVGGTLTGTAGAGFFGFPAQLSAPGTPASGVNLYARSTGALSWKGTNGFQRSFVGTGITADRDYTLPDATGTLLLTDNTATVTNKNLTSGTNTFPTFNQNTTGSAATLTTPRNINGVAFNGSADITVTAAAGTLTGTTLNSTVVSSSLTSVGTISSGTWQGTQIGNAYGGAAGLTGLLKATSGTVLAATSNTDYVNPTSGVFANAFSITGGLTANYLRGDGSAANLVSAVIASAIATATATNTPITTGVSINTALWRLQGQINANLRYAGSFSGVGTATTTFTVTIGTTQANNTYKVNVTPTSSLSAALFYVTNKTTTTFDVVYLTGLTGTVTFDWAVFP